MSMQGNSEGRGRVIEQLPLVTIGITCFNAAETIRCAIDSALKQDWPNKEIIVVDDASTDGSETELREIARCHPELRLIRHDVNAGYAEALNSLIKASRGAFIAIFDDDDESRPDRIANQWKRIMDYERSHGAGLVLCYTN